jgi:hypothetical protein
VKTNVFLIFWGAHVECVFGGEVLGPVKQESAVREVVMKRLGFVVSAAILVVAALMPLRADARVFIGLGFGGCCWGGPGGGYPYYSQPYYAPQVYAPPVVYAAPPQVVYMQPPVATYSYAVPPSVPADQISPTFVDIYGRTCRQFQATVPGAPAGIACVQQDGAWRIVQ